MPAKSTPKKSPAASTTYIDPGKAAPAITLNDQAGQKHTLKEYKGKWVVLYFYPKDDTSGCTKEACQFRDGLGDFSALDAVILGISPDGEASHEKFRQKHDLNFDLLADPDKKICQKYACGRKNRCTAESTWASRVQPI